MSGTRISLAGLFLIASVAHAGEPAVEVFRLGYVNASGLEDTVRALLSPSGKVTVDTSSNSLIVMDTAGAIHRVRETLAKLDVKPLNIRIEVAFVEKSHSEKLNLRISWRLAGGGWMIGSVPPPPGGGPLAIDALTTMSKTESVKKQSLLVMENKPGRIFVGGEYPYTTTGVNVRGRNIYTTQNTEFKEAGTSLYVTASRAGEGKLSVAVEPESSYMEGAGAVNVKRASTAVIIDDPGALVISRTGGESSSSVADIPSGAQRSSSSQSFLMILSAHSEN
jgi:type II secretory pathway component GspD/PulD (secretin)